jgi:hypothetical protein
MEKKTLAAPDIKERFTANWICIRININVPKETANFERKTLIYIGLAHYFPVNKIPAWFSSIKREITFRRSPGL